jgi:hypothetical protein
LQWHADPGAGEVQARTFSLGIRWDQPSLRIAWSPEPPCCKLVRVAYMICLPRNARHLHCLSFLSLPDHEIESRLHLLRNRLPQMINTRDISAVTWRARFRVRIPQFPVRIIDDNSNSPGCCLVRRQALRSANSGPLVVIGAANPGPAVSPPSINGQPPYSAVPPVVFPPPRH